MYASLPLAIKPFKAYFIDEKLNSSSNITSSLIRFNANFKFKDPA